jgi:ParB family chromosome partitioning protein
VKISPILHQIPCTSIIIPRDTRQRKKIDTSDLEPSIAKIGVLNPIILSDDLTLIAGERRLQSSLNLGLETIPAIFISELPSSQAQLIELTENLKRKDLTWQETCLAFQRVHELFMQEARAESRFWNIEATAEDLGCSSRHVRSQLRVAKAFTGPQGEKLSKIDSFQSAYNMITRLDERKATDALADIADGVGDFFDEHEDSLTTGEENGTDNSDMGDTRLNPVGMDISSTTESAEVRKELKRGKNIVNSTNSSNESIVCESFLSWAPSYSGPPFNLLHCDFPYGVNIFGGKWSGRDSHETYGDTKDEYVALIECLCGNLDRIMSPSAHLLFWFSMEHYRETLDIFSSLAPDLIFQKFPLIWSKSDNVGIVPDPRRGPRRVYETAFIASREDRPIVKTVSNWYAAPTDKRYHHSTKPEPMLRHFLTMFVDETTRLLDPTCGSGSALRAAESLEASYVFGLEQDKGFAEGARIALRDFRTLRGK